jgi:hypothetical protein
MGVGCLVAVPDGRGLVAAAHVPVLLVGKPFGWPPGVTISSQLPWAVVHQLLLMVVGAGWLTAAVVARRAGRGACTRCGRGLRRVDGLSPPAAERWGRRAVVVAVVSPAAYASSRIAWALDLPFGVTREWMNQMRADEPTIFVAGAAMGTLGLAGALLTLGLVAGWGEVWPRWIPHFRGRPVRPMTAVVPASVVAVLLVSAGKGWHVAAARGELPEAVLGPNWATVIFGVTLVPWGVALAVAAYCYWLRRRGECPRCRRGGADGHEPLVSAGRQMSAQQSCEHPGTRRELC